MNNFHAKKLVNLDEVEKFLEGQQSTKLTRKQVENLNRSNKKW